MEVLSFLVGTQITGQSRLRGGSLAASCSVTQKQYLTLSQRRCKGKSNLYDLHSRMDSDAK